MSFCIRSRAFEPSYRNTDQFLAIPYWNDQVQSESLVADDLLFSLHKSFENSARGIETSHFLY